MLNGEPLKSNRLQKPLKTWQQCRGERSKEPVYVRFWKHRSVFGGGGHLGFLFTRAHTHTQSIHIGIVFASATAIVERSGRDRSFRTSRLSLSGAFARFRGSRISRTVATLTRAQDKFCCFLLRCFFFFLLSVFCCFCPFYFFARTNGDRSKEFCVRETFTLWGLSPMWVCLAINYRLDFASFKAND